MESAQESRIKYGWPRKLGRGLCDLKQRIGNHLRVLYQVWNKQNWMFQVEDLAETLRLLRKGVTAGSCIFPSWTDRDPAQLCTIGKDRISLENL